MEPDPLGQPARDQGDVRAAARLPLPVPGPGHRGRRGRAVAGALVTGAGRPNNIGFAVARTLEREGWAVATVDLEGDVTVTADLADPAAPAGVLDAAEEAVGPVSALVACHAHSGLGGVLEVTAEDFDRHVGANARGTLLLVAELARRFAGEPGSGRVVAYTSGPPLRGEIAYAASKGAIEWIVLSAAAELAPRGITLNAIDPGPTDTGWMDEELRERIRAETPLGRLGRPEDSAELAAFLCSRRADWITGQILRCDGGWSALRTPRHGRAPL